MSKTEPDVREIREKALLTDDERYKKGYDLPIIRNRERVNEWKEEAVYKWFKKVAQAQQDKDFSTEVSDGSKCPDCHGSKKEYIGSQSKLLSAFQPCPTCKGTGKTSLTIQGLVELWEAGKLVEK